MRLELKEGLRNNQLIDDSYNNDLDGFKLALPLLQNTHKKKKVIIFSDLLESGLTDELLYATIAQQLSNTTIDQIIGVARIEPAAKISPIGSESAGKIVQIHVQEGQFVKKGTLLLTLDQSLDIAQLQQSEAKMLTKQQRSKSIEDRKSVV